MRNNGLGSWPARRARMSPQRTALVYGDDALTYGDLDARVTRLAHAFDGLGVAHGDRVAYLGPNHPAFVETMFATHVLGAVFVPLNFRLAAPELEHMLSDSGASVFVYAPECAGVVDEMRTRLGVRAVVSRDGGPPGDLAYEDLLSGGDTARLDRPVDADDRALILYTSGTTGRPKGAVLTHANLVWNTLNLYVDVDVTTDEVTLVSAPLFHVAALNQTLLPTFLKGGCSVVMPGWDVEQCLDLVQRHRVTWMFGVTAMFAGLAQSPRWESADLSSVRVLMTGGAPVPESLIRTYQERGLLFLQGYGLTETAPGATFLGAEMSVSKAGSAGVPCFFVDTRVVRADGTDVAVGEPGEVLVQGPNVTPGYWQNEEATRAAFTGGWFRSGDIATLDEDGYLYVVDRVKDMYISGGENVYPAEVEGALFAHPAVAECAVIGVPDARWGEVGKAFVVLRPEASADGTAPDELCDFLAGRLARYKVPREVEFLDALPRTGSGKVQKAVLRRREEAG
ncbi:MAG: acyl-CoA synthetase [Actinomycetes bacterium]